MKLMRHSGAKKVGIRISAAVATRILLLVVNGLSSMAMIRLYFSDIIASIHDNRPDRLRCPAGIDGYLTSR